MTGSPPRLALAFHPLATNPWLRLEDRAEFVRALTANPPPRPANMDDLLRLNREGTEIPTVISASATIERVRNGGAGSVIDVRTPFEIQTEHVAGIEMCLLVHRIHRPGPCA